jgi:hypothetical protein
MAGCGHIIVTTMAVCNKVNASTWPGCPVWGCSSIRTLRWRCTLSAPRPTLQRQHSPSCWWPPAWRPACQKRRQTTQRSSNSAAAPHQGQVTVHTVCKVERHHRLLMSGCSLQHRHQPLRWMRAQCSPWTALPATSRRSWRIVLSADSHPATKLPHRECLHSQNKQRRQQPSTMGPPCRRTRSGVLPLRRMPGGHWQGCRIHRDTCWTLPSRCTRPCSSSALGKHAAHAQVIHCRLLEHVGPAELAYE